MKIPKWKVRLALAKWLPIRATRKKLWNRWYGKPVPTDPLERAARKKAYQNYKIAVKKVAEYQRVIKTKPDQDVRDFAYTLIHHPHITEWDGLSTGNDEQRFVEILHTGKVWVPHYRKWIVPHAGPLKGMIACGDAAGAKGRSFTITAYTGGEHTAMSRHYIAAAFDGALEPLSKAEVDKAVKPSGGETNFEDTTPNRTHHHTDYWKIADPR